MYKIFFKYKAIQFHANFFIQNGFKDKLHSRIIYFSYRNIINNMNYEYTQSKLISFVTIKNYFMSTNPHLLSIKNPFSKSLQRNRF